MSDTVLTVLIVAIAVIGVLYMFRRQLSTFLFKASKDGLEAELMTRDPGETKTEDSHRVQISRNKLVGNDNQIEVGREDVGVEDNLLLGQKQKIEVKPDPEPKQKKK